LPTPKPQSSLSRIVGALTLGWSERPSSRLMLRRAAARVARRGLRLRSRRLAVERLGTAIVFAPHPDDETFGLGGTLALLGRIGISPHIAFLTDGGASHPAHPVLSHDDVCSIRRNEAFVATSALGMPTDRLLFLGARDGTLGQLDAEQRRVIVERIEELLVGLRPATVFLPCRRDGSAEHDGAFSLVAEAIVSTLLPSRILEYPVWSIWNPTLLAKVGLSCRRVWRVDISSVLGIKERALAEYRSQTEPIPPDSSSALPPGFIPMFLDDAEYLFEHRTT
jgi:LmbE family N-acetylglucosaminyl deacetylase